MINDPFPEAVDEGDSGRDEQPRPRRWWRVAALAVGIAATAIVVPPLIISWSGNTVSVGQGASATPESTPPVTGTPPAASTPTGPATIETTSAVPPRTGQPRPVASRTVAPPTAPPPVTTDSITAQPEFSPIRIAAGAPGNEMFGRAAAVECPTCASGSRVQYVGQGGVVVVNVPGVPVAGNRTLTITYENGGPPRNLSISVNGVHVTSIVLAGNDDWRVPAYVNTTIVLPVGDSKITFFNEPDPAPDLDEILIS